MCLVINKNGGVSIVVCNGCGVFLTGTRIFLGRATNYLAKFDTSFWYLEMPGVGSH